MKTLSGTERIFRFMSRSITPHIDPAIELIKEPCGFEDVSVGLPVDLDSGCAGFAVYPNADCDIVMLNFWSIQE